jgi:hypothetical protein
LRIIVAEDKLQVTAIYRFVRKFVRVQYFGYLYYKNIPDNSGSREKAFPSMLPLVDRLIKSMYTRPKPNYINEKAMLLLCAAVTE